MKQIGRILLLCSVIAALASPAALAQDTQFKAFAGVVYVTPGGDDPLDVGGTVAAIEASDESGFAVGFEWRASKLFGLELDYLQATHDVEFGGTVIGEVDLEPISATANFHLIHTKFVDFYVGPTVSYVDWSNITLNATGQGALGAPALPTDAETVFGVSAGVDLSFAERFAVVIGLRYLDLEVAPAGGSGLAVDPLIARAGVALRW